MIVWWTGRGWVAFAVPVGCVVFGIFGAQALVEQFPRQLSPSFSASGGLMGLTVGGFACWILGRCWNRDDMPDPSRTRFEAIREHFEDADHTLYSLPMEYWGVLAVSLSALVHGAIAVSWLSSLFR